MIQQYQKVIKRKPGYEKYGIIDRDELCRNKIWNISNQIFKLKNILSDNSKNIIVNNVNNWLIKLTIILNKNYQFDVVFDNNDSFIMSDNKISNAIIKINPINFLSVYDIYSCIYHEIKHIYDHLILKIPTQFKELYFQELITSYVFDVNEFAQYDKDIITSDISDYNVLNIIGNMLFYIEKSECTAYLENIDNIYKELLNDKNFIQKLNIPVYSYNNVKKIIYFNTYFGDYVQIYYNIEKYLKDILKQKENYESLNNEYKNIIKEIYGVNTFDKLLKIYLKRIHNVKIRINKLFTDRYVGSLLNKMIEYNDIKKQVK